MRFRNFLIKLIFAVLVICTSLVNVRTSFAQVQTKDTTASATTTAVDTASAIKQAADASSSEAMTSASEPLISTAVDTTGLSQTEETKPEVDRSPLYKSASYYLLLFFLGCIFIGIIGKILKVYELSREMQGKPSFDWRKIQGVLFAVTLIVGMYGVYWSYTVQGPMGIHESASIHGERIDFMFNITLIITTIVFILTHILLFGFSFKYRGSDKKKAYYYPHNNAVERLWTIVPAIVLTVLVLLGFFTWRSITNVSEADQKSALNIEVIGQQFKWNLRYAGADNQLGLRSYKLISPTNNMGIDFKDSKSWDDKLAGDIVIPVNRPVRVNIGSKDVLHSFYIPDFRVQMNAVPGMVTYFQFTPRFTTQEMREKRNNPNYNYALLCSKICGKGHYSMQSATVRVVTEKEYAEWIAKQQLFYNDDVKKEMQTAEQKKAFEQNNIVLNTKFNK